MLFTPLTLHLLQQLSRKDLHMAKHTKPSYAEQWASAGDKVAPDATKIQTGHIVEKPNYEYMNWIQNRQDVGISYSLQMGIVEWDNATEYQYSSSNWSSYVQRNGVVYKAIQTGTNKDPLTETTYWAIAFDDKGSAATVQTNLNTHITNYGTLTGLTNTATARTNLDVYSKAEAAQKNGDATKLFSVANGTTGNEAVNKSQLDTKAEKNGDSGETFSVATATSAAHAVRKDQFDAKTGISTTTVAGIVEKATQAELNAGTAGVWPDAATIFNGFAQTSDSFTLPEWMGGWKVKFGSKVIGDTSGSEQTDTTAITGFTTISTVLVGSTSPTGNNSFVVHRTSFDDSSVTVVFRELVSEIQTNAGYWWCAIGKV